MKYAMKIECLIDLSDPIGELEMVVSTMLQHYPDIKQRRDILQHLELMAAAGLNAIDEADQAADVSIEGGEAGEPANPKEPQEPESTG